MFLHGLLRDSAHVLTAFYWTCEESLGTFILHLFNEVSNGTLRGSAEVQLAVFSRWQKPCWCSVAVATAEAKPSRYPSSSIPACARPSRSCLKSFSDSIRTNAFPSDGLCGREWRQAKQGALRRIALSSVRYVSVSLVQIWQDSSTLSLSLSPAVAGSWGEGGVLKPLMWVCSEPWRHFQVLSSADGLQFLGWEAASPAGLSSDFSCHDHILLISSAGPRILLMCSFEKDLRKL